MFSKSQMRARAANNQNTKKRKEKMNSNCLSTDHVAISLPVLGLDIAKASVQAETANSRRQNSALWL